MFEVHAMSARSGWLFDFLPVTAGALVVNNLHCYLMSLFKLQRAANAAMVAQPKTAPVSQRVVFHILDERVGSKHEV